MEKHFQNQGHWKSAREQLRSILSLKVLFAGNLPLCCDSYIAFISNMVYQDVACKVLPQHIWIDYIFRVTAKRKTCIQVIWTDFTGLYLSFPQHDSPNLRIMQNI